MAIQIILLIFFLLAIFKVFSRYRSGDLKIGGLFFWTLFWILAVIVVILPNSTFYFSRLVGIGRGADLVVYLSITLIFGLLFRMMVKIERQSREITSLTRSLALDRDKDKDDNPKQ